MNCTIKFIWDADAGIWFSSSNDIPGLILQSTSFDTLLDRIKSAAPEMLELNQNYKGPFHLSIETERIELLEAVS